MVFRTHLILSLLFRSVIGYIQLLNPLNTPIRGTVIIAFDVTVTGSDTGTGQPFITLLKILQVDCFLFVVLLLDGYILQRRLFPTKKNHS